MPGRAKPPEFHHFQVLFTLKKQKRSPQLSNNRYLMGGEVERGTGGGGSLNEEQCFFQVPEVLMDDLL